MFMILFYHNCSCDSKKLWLVWKNAVYVSKIFKKRENRIFFTQNQLLAAIYPHIWKLWNLLLIFPKGFSSGNNYTWFIIRLIKENTLIWQLHRNKQISHTNFTWYHFVTYYMLPITMRYQNKKFKRRRYIFSTYSLNKVNITLYI